jgi:hypothetical protein
MQTAEVKDKLTLKSPPMRRPSDPRRAQIVAENMKMEDDFQVMTSEQLGGMREFEEDNQTA